MHAATLRAGSRGSLRQRIVFLAVLTCLLLLAAATGFVYLIRNSQSSVLGNTETHLFALGQSLAQDYASRTRYELQQGERPALQSPEDDGPDEILSLMTAVVLRREPGVEGGFYSTRGGNLLGYAFPTHEGPGPRPKKDIPGRERPAIENLARKAASTGQVQSLRFSGPRDVVLLTAVPVRINGQILGSTWMMQRLPGVNSGRNLQLLFGSVGFALAAFSCALVAFLITTRVQAGVTAVLSRLTQLQEDLSSRRVTEEQLVEFEQVLTGVDQLSLALEDKIRSERALESRLRHGERLSSLGLFAAGIAHELRNPLATIRLRTQMSQRADELSAVDRNSAVVLTEIARLDAMIERLLYFSRPIQLDAKPTNLHELCQEILEAWAPRFADTSIHATCAGDRECSCMADPGKLRQVIENLLQNAVESLSEVDDRERTVTVRSIESEAFAEIRVEDNGPGVAPGIQGKVLDPFFTTKERGTGLGLSIAYEIVKAHDGDLTLGAMPGGGAVAVVRLPKPAEKGSSE